MLALKVKCTCHASLEVCCQGKTLQTLAVNLYHPGIKKENAARRKEPFSQMPRMRRLTLWGLMSDGIQQQSRSSGRGSAAEKRIGDRAEDGWQRTSWASPGKLK